MQVMICSIIMPLLLGSSVGSSACASLEDKTLSISREQQINTTVGKKEPFSFEASGSRSISLSRLCFYKLNKTINIDNVWNFLEGGLRILIYWLKILPEYNNDTMVLIVTNDTGNYRSNSVHLIVRGKLK